MEEIYALLKLWFCAWLVFQVFNLMSVDFKKIAALIRGSGKE